MFGRNLSSLNIRTSSYLRACANAQSRAQSCFIHLAAFALRIMWEHLDRCTVQQFWTKESKRHVRFSQQIGFRPEMLRQVKEEQQILTCTSDSLNRLFCTGPMFLESQLKKHLYLHRYFRSTLIGVPISLLWLKLRKIYLTKLKRAAYWAPVKVLWGPHLQMSAFTTSSCTIFCEQRINVNIHTVENPEKVPVGRSIIVMKLTTGYK